MTTRVKGFRVTLAEPMREDDARALKKAIGLFHGVVAVEQVDDDISAAMDRAMVRHELREKLARWRSE